MFQVFPGDFDADGDLTAIDIDLLSAAIRQASHSPRFDVNSDGVVDAEDHRLWVEKLKWTYYGDANLDGVFDTLDLVTVFIINEYEDQVPGNSTWADGDWDGDGEFETGDLIVAFQAGGYEQGIRPTATGQPSIQGAARMPLLAMIAGHTDVDLRRRRLAP